MFLPGPPIIFHTPTDLGIIGHCKLSACGREVESGGRRVVDGNAGENNKNPVRIGLV